MKEYLNIIDEQFKKLDSSKVETSVISFRLIQKEQGKLYETTIAHICGIQYSFMSTPLFYCCENFFAYDSFSSVCINAVKLYNKKNKDKIMEFKTIDELKNYCKKF